MLASLHSGSFYLFIYLFNCLVLIVLETLITLAKQRFITESDKIVNALREGELQPTLNTKIPIHDVERYWATISPVLAVIHTVYAVLSESKASEAAVERMFKLEAVVHSQSRAKLGLELAHGVCNVRWNYPILMKERLTRDSVQIAIDPGDAIFEITVDEVDDVNDDV